MITLKDHLDNIRPKHNKTNYRYRGNATSIHTTISKENKRKLIEYGDGSLNKGIDKVIEIADKKTEETRTLLLKIANKIIVDHGVKE